jgi:photosystem II stability/assembly factor-like uncharacterized protein
MVSFTPAKTGSTRVFLIEGRARPDHKPAYQSAMKAGSPSQDFGDIEKIEVPSSTEYGKYVEVGSIRGAVDRVTITLTGRYASDLKSEVLRLARAGCAIDVQINLGACTDPSDYNTYTKKIIIESAFLTNWGSEDLGALGSDEQAKVDESVDVSGREIYELLPPSWAEQGGDVVVNELVDVTLCDTPSCGDCETESDGCKKFFALSKAAGGSPATSPDVVFSLDTGVTWQSHDIDSITGGEEPDELDCLGAYLVIVSEETGSVHYVLLSEFDGATDPDFVEIATGVVTGGEPRAIDATPDGQVAFVAGAAGYIYSTEDPTAGLTVRDAGTANTDNYNTIAALSSTFGVAVGDSGAIAKTTNGTTWTDVTTSPVGAGIHLNTVALRSESVWFIGAANGNYYYTTDGGATWTTGAFPGSGAGTVLHIELAGESVVYLAHQTAATLGRILRSTNGGYDWTVQPDGVGSLALNDKVNAISACASNPDIAVGVGLADNASDGFVVVGSA